MSLKDGCHQFVNWKLINKLYNCLSSTAMIIPGFIFITARIRRMTAMFSQASVCWHLRGWGGGVPHLADQRGTQFFLTGGGGYPILPDMGVQRGRGNPIPGQDGGTPIQIRSQVRLGGVTWGYPLIRTGTGWGTPSQDCIGYPLSGLDGVPPVRTV